MMTMLVNTHKTLSINKGPVGANKRNVAVAAVLKTLGGVARKHVGVGGVAQDRAYGRVGVGGVAHDHVGVGGVGHHIHLEKIFFCRIRQVGESHLKSEICQT